MNTAAALALQSIPFAILTVAATAENRDVFVVVYTAVLGLILSVSILVDGQALLSAPFGIGAEVYR